MNHSERKTIKIPIKATTSDIYVTPKNPVRHTVFTTERGRKSTKIATPYKL